MNDRQALWTRKPNFAVRLWVSLTDSWMKSSVTSGPAQAASELLVSIPGRCDTDRYTTVEYLVA